MTGVKAPVGVLGASVVVTHAKAPHAAAVLGGHVAQTTLPFTGVALSVYLGIALAMVIAGLVLRTFGKSEA